MPPRLSKRQQREQAELEALSGALVQPNEHEGEVSTTPMTNAKNSAFAAVSSPLYCDDARTFNADFSTL